VPSITIAIDVAVAVAPSITIIAIMLPLLHSLQLL
jgi:hypothetical protein